MFLNKNYLVVNARAITNTKRGAWKICLYSYTSFAAAVLAATMDQLFPADNHCWHLKVNHRSCRSRNVLVTSGARSIKPKFLGIPVQNQMERNISETLFRKLRTTSRGCPFFQNVGISGNFLCHLALPFGQALGPMPTL